MKGKTILLFLMFLSFQIIAQELESGFTQLILKLPEKTQPHILYSNALSGMKPASFTKIDEDTYLYRFYSIGLFAYSYMINLLLVRFWRLNHFHIFLHE